MKAEGYSGGLNILDTVNNFWGWTAVSPEVVRDDQWTEFAEVYGNDKHKLGLNEWFEKNAPQAQAQVIERMLEAARKGYWKADDKLLKTLDAAARHRQQQPGVQPVPEAAGPSRGTGLWPAGTCCRATAARGGTTQACRRRARTRTGACARAEPAAARAGHATGRAQAACGRHRAGAVVAGGRHRAGRGRRRWRHQCTQAPGGCRRQLDTWPALSGRPKSIQYLKTRHHDTHPA